MRAAETSDLNKEGLTMGYTENLIDFIGKSTDCYHAVKTAKDRLDENGFTELFEGDKMYKTTVNITLYEIRHQ